MEPLNSIPVMNSRLQKVLFLRLLLPLFAGMIIQEKTLIGKKIIMPLLLVLIVLLCVLTVVKLADHFRWNKIFGILIYAILFFCGMNLIEQTVPTFQFENFRIGRINLIPEEKEKTFKIVLGSIKEKKSGSWYAVDGKILVYIEKTGKISNLEPGDWLIFHGSLQVIEGPSNPMEFDFSKYCKNLGIYWKTYLKNHQWEKLSKNANILSLSGAERVRMKMIRFMEKYNFRHESLVYSILLGYREGLSDAQQKYFATSGAMHVLAVSGLHVGIIYGLLVFFLLFFPGRKSGIMLLFPLLVIWIYAMITGMTPSVARASLMITLYVISKFLNRHTESINIILFSGFILILAEPSVFHQVSFQLSFAAVTGISIVYNGLYRIMKTGYWLPDQILSITCLSIAAQLFTFPISMYYFHQFPNYFLITNLFAIPLSTMILITGCIFWIFAFNITISSFLAVILDRIAGLLDSLTKIFGTLPFSSIVNIHTGIYELIVIYSLIFCLVIYFHTHRVISLYFTLICVLLICAVVCMNESRQARHKEVTVLSVEGISAINLISGSHNMVLTDDTSQVSRSLVSLHCINYWLSADLEDSEFIQIHSDKNRFFADKELFISGYQRDGMTFLQFYDTKIGILSGCYSKGEKTGTSMKIDLLIINATCPVDMSVLGIDIKPDYVVIDREVPQWNAEKLEMACIQNRIPFHNVNLKGYFSLKL
jgi:competence protein ComEC